MKSYDPWSDIHKPLGDVEISARRITGTGSKLWGLYWAIDRLSRCILILQYHSNHRYFHPLPKLDGLLVESMPTEDHIGERILIRLADCSLREIYLRFCLDIVAATQSADSVEEAVQRFLVRTWRWHRLLRNGFDDGLTKEEQKGLIGELCVLEHQLLPVINPVKAIQAWIGPTGASIDFQVGWIGIESKTYSPRNPKLRISSEEQLDTSNTTRLFLYTTEITESPTESASVSVSDVASRVRDIVETLNPAGVFQFEERLSATGFDWTDDYSTSRFLIGNASLFEVIDGFPRIIPTSLTPGVEDVKYSIALHQCQSFRIEILGLTQAITEANDGS